LNVLYITNPEAYLARDGENIVVRIAEEIKFRVPVHNLEGVVCFGYPGASPALLGLCAERGIALSFVTESGKFLARVTGRVNGNVLLRRRQYKVTDDAGEALAIARNFIFGKIYNCRCVLQRYLRDHGQSTNTAEVEEKVNVLSSHLQSLENCRIMDELRGIEGDAARSYYAVFDHLILDQKETFRFSGRSRRPPQDRMNAILSFLYTLLAHDCAAALETVGLDPQVGFLHRERPGRPSLALDLMEELRSYLVDRLALTLVNNRQIAPKGFEVKESGGVLMDEETRKVVITAWQKRKQEEITHPFLKEKIPAGLIPYAQSLLLARYLRGDLDAYPPFLMK
jgi:CRISPR-associated protein Cas1